MEQFRLSAELHGHSNDVRCLHSASLTGSPQPVQFVSGSRDKSVILWAANGSERHFSAKAKLEGHSHFVNSVFYLRPTSAYPSGLILSGGMDKVLLVWNPESPAEPIFTLIGHTDNICSLDSSINSENNSTLILSGSWDKTCRVWMDFQPAIVLSGHSQTVWAVLILDGTNFLTASADKTIKKWHGEKCVLTFTGHSDAVRSLSKIDPHRFLSCSNDGSLRVWSVENGSCYQELHGHTSFVYSVSVMPSGEFLSSGEDHTVRVWKDGKCSQIVKLPAQSVWSVHALDNDDFICGANDGVVRVFSRDPVRYASPDILYSFEQAVEKSTINA